MSAPLFREFKKQASFFFKEKFKTARLALTDVTPAQLMTEEATNGNPWAPDTPTLRSISRAAFELDDYCRIVDILHKRLLKFENKNWRASYNSLIVLEHLLTHGPESVADEFQGDRDVIGHMSGFQYIDDSGYNWGLTVRRKSERILKLLEEASLLKDERNRARRLSRGIQGFGSFCQRQKSLPSTFGRCKSDFINHENQEYQSSSSNIGNGVQTKTYQDDLGNTQMLQNPKENMDPTKEEFHLWNTKGESNPLLDCSQEDFLVAEDDHPFNSTTETHATASLLSARDGILQGC